MNKDSDVICPLGIIGRGCYTCFTNCALYHDNECLIKTYLLILTGVKQKETEEAIKKLQRDIQFTGVFGGLPFDTYTKGSELNGN